MQGKVVEPGRYSKQKMVLGTHTSEGEQNYLMLAEVQLPLADCETDAKGYDEETNEVGGLGAAAGKVQVHPESNDVNIWVHSNMLECPMVGALRPGSALRPSPAMRKVQVRSNSARTIWRRKV